jgi:hypothetical protein
LGGIAHEKSQSRFDKLDFDQWAVLAKRDPAAFELRRAEYLKDVISQAPSHAVRRLKGIQFHVDMLRGHAKHPLGVCMKISSMMFDSLFSEMPQALSILTQNEAPPIDDQQSTNKVVPFKGNSLKKIGS